MPYLAKRKDAASSRSPSRRGAQIASLTAQLQTQQQAVGRSAGSGECRADDDWPTRKRRFPRSKPPAAAADQRVADGESAGRGALGE